MSDSYLAYSIQQMIKNQMSRNNTLPTARRYQAVWNNAEPADANLSNITLQGGGTARYVPKLAHVTGLAAGDSVIVDQSGPTPFLITGKSVGDIRLALYSGDTVPPSGVGSLTQGATTQTTIAFSWSTATDNTGIAGYNITVNGSFIGLVSGTSYTSTGLAAGTSNSFKVQAVDYAGNLGAASMANFSTSADTSHGNFSKTYTGQWSASYGAPGFARITSLANTMAQGYSGGVHRVGYVSFNSNQIVLDLVGATVTSMSIKLTCASAPSGGTLLLISNIHSTNSAAPANSGGIGSDDIFAAWPFTAGQTRTIDWSTYRAAFANGSYSGFMIGDYSSTSSYYAATAYGYAAGVYAPTVTINYSK